MPFTLTVQQKILLGIVLLVVIGGLVFTGRFVFLRMHAVEESTKDIFVGDPGVVTYTDVNGTELSLEDYLGRVLIVTSWASWSPFTAGDFTSLNLIANDYADKGVMFMAINRKETKEQAQRYLSTIPSFPNLKIIIDTQDHFYNSVSGYAMPETIVFDTRGNVVLHLRGAVNATEVRAAIDTALAAE